MNKNILSILMVLIFLCSLAPLTEGNSGGRYNSSSGCGGCHGGSGGATVSMSGQPSSYTAGQTYTLTVSVSSTVSSNSGGFSLEVDKGTLSTGMGLMLVNVNSQGNQATHSITGSSYRSWSFEWTAPSSGSGLVTFDIAGNAANGNGGTSGDNWATTTVTVPEVPPPANNAPSVSNLQLSPSNPVTTTTLTLAYTFDDPDGDAESGTVIHWFRDGVHVTALDDSITVNPSFTTKGETWYAEVTPSDGQDSGNTETSPSLTVINSIPVVDSASISPSSATDEDNLSINMSSSDADGDARSISGIEWYLDGSKINAFDGDSEVPSVAIRSGDVWHAKIKVNDGEADSDWFTTLSITIGSNNVAPVIDSVTLSGPYTTVDDLIAVASASDANGDSVTIEYEWPGTAYTTDTLPSDQTSKGQSWKVKVRATDGSLYSDWVESNSVVIQNSAPTLISMSLDQDTVYFQNEATYTYEAVDLDGDDLHPVEVWSLDGEILTLTLKIRDTDFSNSAELTDTLTIINSPPTVNFSGETSQNALTDLQPVVQTDDANGDTVNVTWQWYRNDFLTTFNSNFVPSSSIAAGDNWLAIVTPNDGIENGTQLEIQFTITNIAPTAQVSTEDILTRGKLVMFSVMDSFDSDGSIVNALWTIDGIAVHQGLTYSTVMPQSLDLDVKVFDDMGDSDSIQTSFNSVEPPLATGVTTKLDGTEVVISWSGDAELWAVAHNGEVIATTSDNQYRFSPSLSGTHSFTVYPVIDNQQIELQSPTSTSSVQLDSESVPDAPGPSESIGMILSMIMIIIGIGGVSYSFIQRRN